MTNPQTTDHTHALRCCFVIRCGHRSTGPHLPTLVHRSFRVLSLQLTTSAEPRFSSRAFVVLPNLPQYKTSTWAKQPKKPRVCIVPASYHLAPLVTTACLVEATRPRILQCSLLRYG